MTPQDQWYGDRCYVAATEAHLGRQPDAQEYPDEARAAKVTVRTSL